jgi:hypothetical protein
MHALFFSETTEQNPPETSSRAPLDPFGRPLDRGRLVHYRLPGWPAGHWEHGHVAATRHGRVLVKRDLDVVEVEFDDLLPF